MIRVTSFSEAGGHAVSEDAFEVHRHPSDPDCWLCFLADGQGGQSGGAEAARIACRVASGAAFQLSPQQLSEPSMWITLLKQADAAVCADPDAGFTTLIGLCITGDALHGALSGDGAVLVVSEGGVPRQATADQLKNPPVGSGAARFVPFSASLAGRWSVLAMSDGVWKYVGWERIFEAVATHRGPSLVAALQGAARLRRSGNSRMISPSCCSRGRTDPAGRADSRRGHPLDGMDRAGRAFWCMMDERLR